MLNLEISESYVYRIFYANGTFHESHCVKLIEAEVIIGTIFFFPAITCVRTD